MVHLRSKVRGTPRNAYRNIESACSPILAVVLASPRMLLVKAFSFSCRRSSNSENSFMQETPTSV
jgi:hypothetical protein